MKKGTNINNYIYNCIVMLMAVSLFLTACVPATSPDAHSKEAPAGPIPADDIQISAGMYRSIPSTNDRRVWGFNEDQAGTRWFNTTYNAKDGTVVEERLTEAELLAIAPNWRQWSLKSANDPTSVPAAVAKAPIATPAPTAVYNPTNPEVEAYSGGVLLTKGAVTKALKRWGDVYPVRFDYAGRIGEIGLVLAVLRPTSSAPQASRQHPGLASLLLMTNSVVVQHVPRPGEGGMGEITVPGGDWRTLDPANKSDQELVDNSTIEAEVLSAYTPPGTIESMKHRWHVWEREHPIMAGAVKLADKGLTVASLIQLGLIGGGIAAGGAMALLSSGADDAARLAVSGVDDVARVLGDDAARVLTTEYGDDVGRLILAGSGDDIGRAILSGGDEFGRVVMSGGDDAARALATYGDDVARQAVTAYADDMTRAVTASAGGFTDDLARASKSKADEFAIALNNSITGEARAFAESLGTLTAEQSDEFSKAVAKAVAAQTSKFADDFTGQIARSIGTQADEFALGLSDDLVKALDGQPGFADEVAELVSERTSDFAGAATLAAATQTDELAKTFADDLARVVSGQASSFTDDLGRLTTQQADDFADDLARSVKTQSDNFADDLARSVKTQSDEFTQSAGKTLAVTDPYTGQTVIPQSMARAMGLTSDDVGLQVFNCPPCQGGQGRILIYQSNLGGLGMMPVGRKVAVTLGSGDDAARILQVLVEGDNHALSIIALGNTRNAAFSAVESQGWGLAFKETKRVPILGTIFTSEHWTRR